MRTGMPAILPADRPMIHASSKWQWIICGCCFFNSVKIFIHAVIQSFLPAYCTLVTAISFALRYCSSIESPGFSNINEQAIRSAIIAPLRDKGVLISSCSKGYKIPRAHSDLLDFIHRVDSQVVPLLDRLNKARNSYLMGSRGEFDLLTGLKFPLLVSLLKTLEEQNKAAKDHPI